MRVGRRTMKEFFRYPVSRQSRDGRAGGRGEGRRGTALVGGGGGVIKLCLKHVLVAGVQMLVFDGWHELRSRNTTTADRVPLAV